MTPILLQGVEGDVPAEGRLLVTPAADCDWIAWGIEHRHYSGADLLLNTPDLTVTGFAGTSTTRAGSNSTNVFRGTLTTTPVAVCGTGDKPHIGTYRVYARLWASAPGVRVRLTYRDGDGPLKSLNWETPPAEDAWVELDLGVITIAPKVLGAQRWTGQIEAYTDTPGDTLDVDYLILMPAGEGFGKARRLIKFETSTTFTARDEFDQSAGVLTGKALPVGGTWGGTGDADDFSAETTGKTAQRTAVSDASHLDGRYAIAGTATPTSTVVQVDLKTSLTDKVYQGVFARYVSATGARLAARVQTETGVSSVTVYLHDGSSWAQLSSESVPPIAVNAWYSIRLVIDTGGRWAVWVFRAGAIPGAPTSQGYDVRLASGGALASGGFGIYDAKTLSTAATRNYDNFLAFVPTADAVCFANQSIEFRHDGETLREDASGTYYGRPREYRGAPLLIPPAGDKGGSSRIAVMVRKNDVATMPNPDVATSYTAQVHYTPRRRLVPR